MSYRDPQQAIDQTYTVLAQGLEKFYATIGGSIEAFAKKKKTDELAAQKALNKRLNTGMKPFLSEYNKTVKESTKFTSKMKDEGPQLQAQITGNLGLIRNQLKREITALGVDATDDQIQDLSDRALQDVTLLKTSIEKFNKARKEYAETAGLRPDQVNAIVPTRNQGLIAMMGDFVDDGKHNMFLHNVNYDPNNPQDYVLGNSDWNISNYEGTAGEQDFEIKNSINAATIQIDPVDDTFFNHVKEFDPKAEYSAIHTMIKDAIDQRDDTLVEERTDRPPTRGSAKDKSKYVVSKDALKNKLLNTKGGQTIMHTYTDDEDAYGHWQQMGEYDDVNPATNIQSWSTHQGGSQPYSEEAYWNAIIDRAIESYRYE